MFYNLYKDSINVETLKLAVKRTAKKRDSLETMSEWEEIIEDMKEDIALKNLWNNYCENNTYGILCQCHGNDKRRICTISWQEWRFSIFLCIRK